MGLDSFVSTVPLQADPEGIIRVDGTRVTLDSVVGTFKHGSTCEEIVLQFPVLDLGAVYAVIGYYLQNQVAVDQYLAEQQDDAWATRQKIEAQLPPAGIRQRLIQRRPTL